MNRKAGRNKKKGGKKGVEAESVIALVRESLRGHVVPEFEWGAKSDPEFFGLGGAGAYIVSGAYDVDDWDDDYDHDRHDNHDDHDYDAILGGYLGAGIHYNITPRIFHIKPRIFVGVEGKYLWTDKAKLKFEEFGVPLRVKFKMDGIIATAVIGIKF